MGPLLSIESPLLDELERQRRKGAGAAAALRCRTGAACRSPDRLRFADGMGELGVGGARWARLRHQAGIDVETHVIARRWRVPHEVELPRWPDRGDIWKVERVPPSALPTS